MGGMSQDDQATLDERWMRHAFALAERAQGEYDEIPTWRARPERTAVASAPIVSSSGVVGSKRWL